MIEMWQTNELIFCESGLSPFFSYVWTNLKQSANANIVLITWSRNCMFQKRRISFILLKFASTNFYPKVDLNHLFFKFWIFKPFPFSILIFPIKDWHYFSGLLFNSFHSTLYAWDEWKENATWIDMIFQHSTVYTPIHTYVHTYKHTYVIVK